MNPLRLQRRLSPLLRPASAVYSALMRLREKRYATPTAKNFRARCPVVSVGNIAWGGTGKTPVVDWLLAWAETRGLTPIALTRGYGGKPPRLPFSVSPAAAPDESGDEPLYLAARHPGALVLVDPKRARAAAWAEKNAGPDLFILDDGMQHLAMERDVNLVLLRPEDLLDQWNRVIPAGSWREGVNALHRADAFLLRADPLTAGAVVRAAETRLAVFGKPLFFFDLISCGLRRLKHGSSVNQQDAPRREHLDGADYALLCAVGSPKRVRTDAIQRLGREPAAFYSYPDHHAFSPEDIAAVTRAGLPPELPVVCTGKDAVKLRPLLEYFGARPVWEMDAAVRFGNTLFCRDSFPVWWEKTWTRLPHIAGAA